MLATQPGRLLLSQLSVGGHKFNTLIGGKSFLFHSSDVQSKAGPVTKYVTPYGIEVHQTLHLPRGFMQVSLPLIILLPA